MKAGKSNYEVGTRIRIKNIQDEDADMNGLTGKLTHPFGCYPADYVGVWLDEQDVVFYNDCNLKCEHEFEVIK